jgi:hypothetical protein
VPLSAWLERIFSEGVSMLDAAPGRAGAAEVLRRAFARHAEDVAGPAIPLHLPTAQAAAEYLAAACWALGEGGIRPACELPGEPNSPSEHLSADLCLRLLPGLLRRQPGSELAEHIAATLARWPLSGVLAELPGPPAKLEFAHPGLEMLYAERLSVGASAGWVPVGGRLRECIDRVADALGRPAHGAHL